MSRRIIRVVLAGALLAAAVAGCSTAAEAGRALSAETGWRQLPDAPLGTRESPVLVAVGDRVLVVGGEEFSCPPNADCTASEEPLFDDGAVYDAATDSWRAAAPAPFGLRAEQHATAALDGTAFLLTRCASGTACDAPQRLLSYRLADDRWTDHGPVPGPAPGPRRILPLDRTPLGRRRARRDPRPGLRPGELHLGRAAGRPAAAHGRSGGQRYSGDGDRTGGGVWLWTAPAG